MNRKLTLKNRLIICYEILTIKHLNRYTLAKEEHLWSYRKGYLKGFHNATVAKYLNEIVVGGTSYGNDSNS